MKSGISTEVQTHKVATDEATLQIESENFVAQQRDLYEKEIGHAITDLLRDAADRGFTHDLWVLDDRFLARIDALCDIISTRATVYYGISKAANRSLLRELERYVKQLASGLDVLAAQLSENVLSRRSQPRYQQSIASVSSRIHEVEEKLVDK